MNKKRVLKVGLIWANPYNLNLGVAALAYSAIALIKDVALHNRCEIELTVIGSTRVGKESLTLRGTTYDFFNIKGMDYLELKTLAKVILRWNDYKVNKLSKFDLVFDVGEGDSFSDIYGIKRFNRINNSKRIFSWLGVKQALLPQTIGPFYSAKVKSKAVSSLKSCEVIFPRDRQSYCYSKDCFKNKHIKESVDIAFYLPFEKAEFDTSYTHVGLNISGLLWMGGYTKKNQFKLKTDYIDCTTKIIEYFLKQDKVKLHIVPHVVGKKEGSEGDYLLSKQLCEEYENLTLSPLFSTPIEAKSYISGLDFFIGARMHSCIAAFSSGVPVLPLAYSRKFIGLFSETLEYSTMGNCMNDSTEVILEKVIVAYENLDTLKAEIQHSLKSIIDPKLSILKQEIGKMLSDV